jgi:hypothetical protein
MGMTEEERKEMYRKSELEGRAKKYGYLTAFPFTFVLIAWAVIDKRSPDAAIYPVLLISAFVNMLPMILFEEIYKKVLSK